MEHSAQVTVSTEDNKALRMLLSLSRDAGKDNKELKQFLRPILKQVGQLQEKIQSGLLDLDTPLGKG